MITSTLEQLQSSLVSKLSVDTAFNGSQSINGKPVPIVTEQVGDVVSYTQSVIGQMGLVAIILTPDMKLLDHTKPSLVGTVLVQIQVSEFYAINRATTGIGISAQSLAIRIVELLHRQPNGVVPNIAAKEQLISFLGLKLKPNTDPRRAVTYLLMFSTMLGIKTL